MDTNIWYTNKNNLMIVQWMTNIKNIIAPSDSYYLLGDNRDNAVDSRYEGFIKKIELKDELFTAIGDKTKIE